MQHLSDMMLNANRIMFRRLLLIQLLSCLPLVGYAADSSSEAYTWLEKMHNAVQQLNYEGTFVYLHGQHMETMRIIHTIEDGVERERLVSMNGAQREVVRSKGEVVCIQPDTKTVIVGKRFGHRGISNILTNEPSKLSDYYDLSVHGEERIAGKDAKMILIIPKDKARYGHMVSLEMESGLPLRSDLLDASGKPVSQIMFTSMKTGPEVHDNKLELVTKDELKQYTWSYQKPTQEQGESASTNGQWVFDSVPNGFKMSVHEMRPGAAGENSVEHFVFTDGLATMSVYIEKAVSGKLFEGRSQMGAINVFGTKVGGFQVIAVGEVPALTVERFAQSVQPKQE
jgi:sigma-E factor negative regulatory protein RseB